MPFRPNFENIRTFVAVVRFGSTRVTADRLGLTQPAVSTRIKNLEASLNTRLFERTGAGLKLTKKGEILLNYANQLLHIGEMIERDVINEREVDGRLRIGISETIAQSWLPDLVSRLNCIYPKLNIDIAVDISSSLREALLNNQIDLAILLGPISDFSVENIDLPQFALAWYRSVSNDDDLATLMKKPIGSYARHTRPFRELRDTLFERYGSGPRLYPSSTLSACFKLVESDICIAALPRHLAGEFIKRGTICEFDPGWVPSPLHFTASFLADPKSHIAEQAAHIAAEVANNE